MTFEEFLTKECIHHYCNEPKLVLGRALADNGLTINVTRNAGTEDEKSKAFSVVGNTVEEIT